jgi:hypothetical protein
MAGQTINRGWTLNPDTSLNPTPSSAVLPQNPTGGDIMKFFAEQMQAQNQINTELREELRQSRQREGTGGSTSNTQPNHAPQIGMPKLEPLKITPFSGRDNGFQFMNFVAEFDGAYHLNTRLTEQQKLQYLRQSVTEDAKRKIEDLPSQPGSYEIARDRLNQAYGNRTNSLQYITNQIDGLRIVPPGNAQALDYFLDKLISYVSIMGLNGFNADMLVPTVYKKVAPYMMDKVTEAMGRSPTMNQVIQVFQGQLEVLKVRDMVQKPHLDHQNQNQKGGRSSSQFDQQEDFGDYGDTSELFQNSPNGKPGGPQRPPNPNRPGCGFCLGQHKASNCDWIPNKSLKEKREALVKNKRCIRCTGTHMEDTCWNRNVCMHCQDAKHHTYICPVFYGDKKSTQANESTPATPQTTQIDPIEVQTCPEDYPVPVSMQCCFPTGIKPYGVVMPVIPFELSDENRQTLYLGNVLLDSGAETTCISWDLCEKLKLVIQGYETFRSVGFGTETPRIERAGIAFLTVKSPTTGANAEIVVRVIKKLTGEIKQNGFVLPESIVQGFEKDGVMNIPPQSARPIQLDVIVGNDFDTVFTRQIKMSNRIIGDLDQHFTRFGTYVKGNAYPQRIRQILSRDGFFKIDTQTLLCRISEPESEESIQLISSKVEENPGLLESVEKETPPEGERSIDSKIEVQIGTEEKVVPEPEAVTVEFCRLCTKYNNGKIRVADCHQMNFVPFLGRRTLLHAQSIRDAQMEHWFSEKKAKEEMDLLRIRVEKMGLKVLDEESKSLPVDAADAVRGFGPRYDTQGAILWTKKGREESKHQKFSPKGSSLLMCSPSDEKLASNQLVGSIPVAKLSPELGTTVLPFQSSAQIKSEAPKGAEVESAIGGNPIKIEDVQRCQNQGPSFLSKRQTQISAVPGNADVGDRFRASDVSREWKENRRVGLESEGDQRII